jgi:MFS family permease
LVWAGQATSFLGDWLTIVALFQLADQYGKGVQAVGLVVILHTLAPVLAGPIAGYLSDRVDRRRLLIACDLIRMVIALGFLLVDSAGDLVLLYVLASLMYGMNGIFIPAHRTFLQGLARGPALITANALWSATYGASGAFGAMASGVLVSLLGTYSVFVLDAITFVVSAVLLSAIRPDEIIEEEETESEARSEEADGKGRDEATGEKVTLIQALRRDKRIFYAMTVTSSLGMVGGGTWVLLIKYGQDYFPLGENGALSVGVLNAVMFLGVLIGASLTSRLYSGATTKTARRFLAGHVIRMCAVFLFAAAPLAAGLDTYPTVLGIAAAGLGVMLNNMCGAAMFASTSVLFSELVHPSVRGRVFALDNVAFTIASTLATYLVGYAMDHHGWSASQAGSAIGVGTMVIVVLWLTGMPAWTKADRRTSSSGHRGQAHGL